MRQDHRPELHAAPEAKHFTLPPPTLEEFESLVNSIRKDGIQDAIIYTESGELIAGENRLRAAQILGLKEKDVPKKIIPDRSPKEAHDLRLSLNIVGRQCLTDTRKEYARHKLLEDPALSSRAVADLAGIDKNTAQQLKEEMQAGGEIHQPEHIKGKDGKIYTKSPTKSDEAETKAKQRRATKKDAEPMPASAKNEKVKPPTSPGTRVYDFPKSGAPKISIYVVSRETREHYCYLDGTREKKIKKKGTFASWAECKKALLADAKTRLKNVEQELKLAQERLSAAKALKPSIDPQ